MALFVPVVIIELNNVEVTSYKTWSLSWFGASLNMHWYFNFLLEICYLNFLSM